MIRSARLGELTRRVAEVLMALYQGLAFVAVLLVFLGLSWEVLRDHSPTASTGASPGSVLDLLVLSAPVWFVDLYALQQRLSWLLLFGSLLLFAVLYQLHRIGRSNGWRMNAELCAFERTWQLLTSGIFRLILHPLNASLLLLAWGVVCK